MSEVRKSTTTNWTAIIAGIIAGMLLIALVIVGLRSCSGPTPAQANPTPVVMAQQPTVAAPPAASTTQAEQPAQSAATSENSCPQAADLGPWAPSGSPETFEVTAARGYIVLSLWWPEGKTPWGTKEVTMLLPNGTSIEVLRGGGRGWDYSAECSLDEVVRQMTAHNGRRVNDTSFFGQVTLQQLLDLKLVRNRR